MCSFAWSCWFFEKWWKTNFKVSNKNHQSQINTFKSHFHNRKFFWGEVSKHVRTRGPLACRKKVTLSPLHCLCYFPSDFLILNKDTYIISQWLTDGTINPFIAPTLYWQIYHYYCFCCYLSSLPITDLQHVRNHTLHTQISYSTQISHTLTSQTQISHSHTPQTQSHLI
jgi:hypothetical protein